jgi:GNAT superfamily N-acetyltransferase
MVQQLIIDDIMALRVRVLRQGTPATHAHYPEDNYPDVVHLGIKQAGDVIATSTWFLKICPEFPDAIAMQLKGMAVDTSLQSGGYGAQLIQAGIALATERNAEIVWARARDSALGFYEKCGFSITGEGFIDEPTNMPHHIVVRTVLNRP